jgi:ATP synthase protein I
MGGGESNGTVKRAFEQRSAEGPVSDGGDVHDTISTRKAGTMTAPNDAAPEAGATAQRPTDSSAAHHTAQAREPQQMAGTAAYREPTEARRPSDPPAAATGDWDVGLEDNTIVPLTRAEAEQMFGANVGRPSRVTPFKVVAAQMVVSLVAALVCWQFLRQPGAAARSALLGGAICWVPGALFALRLRMVGHRQSMFGWMVGEAIKMGVTIAMFVAIAKYVPDLRWLPLLVTYLVALKTYWVALALR